MEFLISICIVSFNSSKFILNTLYCLEKITKNNYKVIIRDNNSNLKDFHNLEKKIQNYKNVELYRVENFDHVGSIAHGIGLNDLITKIDTKYGVILDADCTFLLNNWDEILIKELNDEYPIIGTRGENGYGENKPRDFPVETYAMMFDADILKKLQVDFLPDLDQKIYQDVGYKLRDKYHQSGYKGNLITGVNTRYVKTGPFKKYLCYEYYFDNYEKIFACHFGRGSTLGQTKYLKSKMELFFYRIPILGGFLLSHKGKSERRKWIKICHDIVNKN